MISQGLILMAVGMGVVFTFLIVMIGFMNILRILMKPLNKLIPEPEEKKAVRSKPTVVIDNNEEIAIAIAAIKSMVN